jgi:hypothetical protein
MNPVNVFSALKIIEKIVENPAKAVLLTNSNEIEALLSNNNKGVKALSLRILLKVSREDKIQELLERTHEVGPSEADLQRLCPNSRRSTSFAAARRSATSTPRKPGRSSTSSSSASETAEKSASRARPSRNSPN